jgi:hypothetical protein
MPPLSHEENAALKADIELHGVLVPVEVDEEGNILDGFHRRQICDGLNIDCPTVVRHDLTDGQKFVHAWMLNLARRHLDREQKQTIAGQLRRAGWTHARIATTLDVSRATVSMWLTELVNSDKLAAPTRIPGRDGKHYPARKRRRPPIAQPSKAALAKPEGGTQLPSAEPQGVDAPLTPTPEVVDATAAGGMPVAPSSAASSVVTHDALSQTVAPGAPAALTEQADFADALATARLHPEPSGAVADRVLMLVHELSMTLTQIPEDADVLGASQPWDRQTALGVLDELTHVIGRLQAVHHGLRQAHEQGRAQVDDREAEGLQGQAEGATPDGAAEHTPASEPPPGPEPLRPAIEFPVDEASGNRSMGWRERAQALAAQGYSPADIAIRFNTEEGLGRWNAGSVRPLLHAGGAAVREALSPHPDPLEALETLAGLDTTGETGPTRPQSS